MGVQNPKLASFSREIIQQVLAANDIVDVIGAYVDLKPSGTDRFVGLSPFQNERTPSFHVTRSRQMYYCFSTGQGGDLIKFLQVIEGLSFVEAVERLAERANVALPSASAYDKREDYERKQVAELGAFALKHFKAVLDDPIKGGPGRKYVQSRALKPETLKRFALGFAPAEHNNLLDAARAAKFPERILELSGLLKRGQRGDLYDFFRGRVMIPIRDTAGRVVAFGGRDITGEAPGKYINSPENILYKKGRTLYGIYESREAMRHEKKALLVEGYFDLMRCHDVGVENVVASCGTALTPEQARLIRRYCEEVIILFDGDAAGIRAATRGVGVLMGAGLGVRIVTLPGGVDPDDYIRDEGVAAFRQQLAGAVDFISYYAAVNADRLASVEGRDAVAKDLFAIVREVEEPVRQDAYLQEIARSLRLSENAVRSAFSRVVQRGKRPAQEARDASTETEAKQKPVATYRAFSSHPDDVTFVAALLAHDAVRVLVEAALEDWWILSDEAFDQVVYTVCTAEDDAIDLQALSSDAQALYAASATADPPPAGAAEDLATQRLNRVRREILRAEGLRIEQEIRAADASQDTARVIELTRQRFELRQQMDAVSAA